MKNCLLYSLMFLASSLYGQAPPAPYGVLPTKAQLKWHEMEMYCIIHFSMGTFNDKEWGFGDENPSTFNPSQFDASQIINAAKAGGFKGAVIVAKHHDGFCLWPTNTTTHNITQSPWKNGKGDIVKEYQQACKKAGVRLGLYCSPWDRNSPWYGKPEYVSIYREQLKELYKGYGRLFISWHDGANGGDGYYGGARESRKIDRTTYYGWDSTWAITRNMQPSAVIFGDVGPDVRWVGNEEGHAGETSWATYTPQAPDEGKKPANGYIKHWEGTEGTRNGRYWMPAECDVPLRPGWFYHQAQDNQVKSAKTLLDLYYKSVGRGACLDLGLAPDKRGLLPQADVDALKQFGGLLKQTFSVNLAKGAALTATNIRGNQKSRYGTGNVVDGDRYTYWATDDSVKTASLTVDLYNEQTFNVIRLRENIKLGQRIDSVSVDVQNADGWKEIAKATSIGANRLIRLSQPVTAQKLRLRITSAVCIALSDFGLFREPLLLNTVDKSIQSSYLSKSGWKVISADNEAKNIIDENINTIWTPAISGTFPQDIVIDMGKVQTIKAFTYLPRQDKNTNGIADKYIYFISTDGKEWKKVAEGEFSNIRANPVEQVTPLKERADARYYKFSVLRVIEGNGVSIAESGVKIK